MLNGICHVDFSARDASLADFYAGIFGWQLTPMGDTYTLWRNGEENLGGGFSQPMGDQPFAPGQLVYIHVEDIDATLASISAAGGSTVMPKMEIGGGHGFCAIFQDPQGNKTGLWSQS